MKKIHSGGVYRMTLFSYEIFDAVARQGSFNKAAQQLHLTPSAISHAIAVMEEELGFALFTPRQERRDHDQLRRLPLPAIRAVLNSDEALQQSIARLNGLEKGQGPAGHLQLGLHPPAARHSAELQGAVPADRGGGLPGHLRRRQGMAAQRPGGHRLSGFELSGGIYPHRAAAGAAAGPAAGRLARARGRRDDPRHDEPEELCGAGRRHRRRYAPFSEEVQDRRAALLPRHRRHGQYLDGEAGVECPSCRS